MALSRPITRSGWRWALDLGGALPPVRLYLALPGYDVAARGASTSDAVTGTAYVQEA
jgi:hypothetical protein